MLSFTEYLRAQIGAIYVWGGQGESLSALADPEGWIRKKETGTKNAERAIALFRERKAEGVCPILCYDCSGLIVSFLLQSGIVTGDRTAQGLMDMCETKLDSPEQPGDLVARWSSSQNKVTHIGVYMGQGRVIEAKGRDVGVVETTLSSGGWNRAARLSALTPFIGEGTELSLGIASPLRSGGAYAAMQRALNALGYTDDKGNALVTDGKWGKKSREAWEKASAANGVLSDYAITVDRNGTPVFTGSFRA